MKDRFGDYGIVGYYCVDKHTHQLLHFVFSCRILNLGIEQFLYAYLNYPKLETSGDIAGQISHAPKPEWIEFVSDFNTLPTVSSQSKTRILFKGGCDLSQMLHYLGSYDFEVINETNYVAQNNFPIHAEHSQMLLDSQRLIADEKTYLSDTLPFIDDKTYESVRI